MINNKNFNSMNDILLKFILSFQLKMIRDINMSTVKMFTSLMKEADSRKHVIRVLDKLAQMFFNHDKEKYLRNNA